MTPGAGGGLHDDVSALIWLARRRDLGWRRRRFVIAVAAITLVLALTLLLSGFRDGIDVVFRPPAGHAGRTEHHRRRGGEG